MATADLEIADAKGATEVRREPEVNKLFRMVMKHEGSDLHLKVGLPPMMRLKNAIRQMEMRPLSQDDMEHLLDPILTERARRIRSGLAAKEAAAGYFAKAPAVMNSIMTDPQANAPPDRERARAARDGDR